MNNLGNSLKTNKIAQLSEIIVLFLLAFAFITFIVPVAGDNLVYKQAIIWIANIMMLGYVWIGLKLRGESWRDLGLILEIKSWKEGLNTIGLTLFVFALAMIGFIIGSIIMANITGIPEGSADMSNYSYLQNNPFMLLITLIGVWIVSSFGEEVIYRGFLITRFTQLGFQNKYGNIIAVSMSALIFGLAHYDWGPMGIVQTTFMGLALGYCYLKFKRRLWLLVMAHAYMDTILMIQMYLNTN